MASDNSLGTQKHRFRLPGFWVVYVDPILEIEISEAYHKMPYNNLINTVQVSHPQA